ncbi:MAG: hypothetical protein QS721_15595 [Candidatus Endonucleobacter sp. (ex Gigantidas childressi)]|nr:hypothetical protein [Candidatus Endonucleobacter sp. (ex Gigantidas childressi)]
MLQLLILLLLRILKILLLGGGIGFADAITAVDLTVIDTVIDVSIKPSLYESAVGGGFGRSYSGVQFSNTMIIKTNLSIYGDVGYLTAGWVAGRMAESNGYGQLAVSQSFINITGVAYIKIGGAVGLIDSASISNFTVSRSRALFEGQGSNVQIGFCMGDNTDGESKCDFDETKKIFDNSSYNDANGVSYHQYNYNMNLANQCRRSKLPFIGNDCEIKPEEYCRYKEPLIMVWNAPCLMQAQTPASAATVPTTTLGVSSAAFIAVAAVGGGFYWYKRHNNGGCCSGHRELSTEDGDNQSGKDEQKYEERPCILAYQGVSSY